jgi:murein DD-endopeptidase MepM/ murein hydrolase activator NlpD/pimeloyl-ACP methyl ester carboxylesterase
MNRNGPLISYTLKLGVIFLMPIILVSGLIQVSSAENIDIKNSLFGQENEIIGLREEYTKYFKVVENSALGYKIIARTSTAPLHVFDGEKWEDFEQTQYLTSEELLEDNIYAKINPQSELSSAYADTFVSPSTYGVAQGGVNPRKPLFIGSYFDIVPSAWYMDSKTFLSFPKINKNVKNAKLKVWHYGSNSSTTYVDIRSFDRPINEYRTIFPGPNITGQTASISFDYIPQQNRSFERTSSDISQIVNSSGNQINLSLTAQNQRNRGVVICSKDWIAIQCINKSPVIEYELVQPPTPPNPIKPDNYSEYIGNCDQSKTEVSGICNGEMDVNFEFNNIKEYDKYPEDSTNDTEIKIQLSNANSNYNDFTNYVAAYNQYQTTQKVTDGDYFYRGVVRSGQFNSLENPFDSTVNKKFLVDSTPPSIPDLSSIGDIISSNYQYNLEGISDNLAKKEQITIYFEVSKSPDFTNSDIIFTTTQTNNNIIQIANLQNENKYFIRAKAGDREFNKPSNISAWSKVKEVIVDSKNPEVGNIQQNNIRFSPNNSTSIGEFDSFDINFEVVDINYDYTELVITNSNKIEVNKIKITEFEEVEGKKLVSYKWLGDDQNGSKLVDGVYNIEIKAYDKARNTNEVNSTNIINAVIDNSGANIGLASPANNFETNQNSWNITGSVGIFNSPENEDKDFVKLEIKKPKSTTFQDITTKVDKNNNFIEKIDLDSELNEFSLKSTDLVANKIDKIGDPKNNPVLSQVIIKDQINPKITNLKPRGLLKNGDKNNSPILEFDIDDDSIDRGLIDNLSLSLISRELNNNEYSEIILYNKGIKVNDSLINSGIVCQKIDIISQKCNLELKSLELGREYFVNLMVFDRAGNASCLELDNKILQIVTPKFYCQINSGTKSIPDPILINGELLDNPINDLIENSQSFVVDYPAFLEISSPKNNDNFSSKNVIIKGKTKYSSKLKIEYQNQIKEVLFFDNNSDDNLTYICEQKTREFKNCDFEYILNIDLEGQTKLDNISIKITSEDLSGNIKIYESIIGIDLNNLEVKLDSNFDHFSPNGDGNQDGIVFFANVINPKNVNENPQLSSSTLTIRDRDENIVWSYNKNGNYDREIFFDGKCNVSFCQSGEFLQDGEYSASLEAISIDNIKFISNTILLKSSTSQEGTILITNPKTGFVTSRDVINVQGQAPNNLKNSNIIICINSEFSGNCVNQRTTKVDEIGFYSSIVSLGDTASNNFRINAYGFNEFGIRIDSTNFVDVTRDTKDPFESINITPTFQSLTSKEDFEKFEKGLISIDEIRSIELKMQVSQNTKATQINLASYINQNRLPQTDPLSGQQIYYNSNNLVALINDIKESNTNLNPANDERIKLNHLPITSPLLPENEACNDQSCQWIYQYPIKPDQSGGIYELEFVGYKAENVQKAYRGYILDGSVLTEPKLLRIEKANGQFLNEKNSIYYTNSTSNIITGVADPNTDLEIDFGGVILKTRSAQTGLWKVEIDFGGDVAEVTKDIIIKAIKSEINTQSSRKYTIKLDKTLPELIQTKVYNTDFEEKKWLRSGDRAEIVIESNESLENAFVIKEDLFLLKSKPQSDNKYVSSLSIDGEEGIYYPTIRLVDLAGNITQFSNNKDFERDNKFNFQKNLQTENIKTVIIESFDEIYSNIRENNLDFRIFVDNTPPDNSEILKNDWGKSPEGFKASPIFPENDRIIDQLVTRHNNLQLSGFAEKNQNIEIIIRGSQTTKFNNENSILSTNKLDSNCTNPKIKDKITRDNLITKFASDCEWSYDFSFEDDGLSPDGIPYNWYIFNIKVVDLSGNNSKISKSVIVYHDKDKPKNHSIINIKSDSYDPIVNYGSPNQITKDYNITTTHFGERQADVEYQLFDKNNNFVDKENTYLKNGVNPEKRTNYGNNKINLGEQKKDQSQGDQCMKMEGTRRVGTCSDGIYSLKMRMIDSAGNTGDFVNYSVERDTVEPVTPVLSVSKFGDILSEALDIEIRGEAYSTAKIEITDENGGKNILENQVDSKGNLSLRGAIKVLKCGKITYKVKVTLTDLAQNESNQVTRQVTSKECPRCSELDGDQDSKLGFGSPFKSDSIITSYYGKRTLFGEINDHTGIDLVPKNGDLSIYPIQKGVVVDAKYFYTDNDKFNSKGQYRIDTANYVMIKHENNYYSLYVHLKNEKPPVFIGETVDTNTRIGTMGNTGFSTNPHLHLEIRRSRNGKSFNPLNYLPFSKGNLTKAQELIACKGGDGSTEGDYYDNRNSDELGDIELTYEVSGDGMFQTVRLSKSKIPAPEVVKYYTDKNRSSFDLFGIAIRKKHKIKVTINKRDCGFQFPVCKTKTDTIYKELEHSEVNLVRKSLFVKKVGSVWNDDENGRFKMKIDALKSSNEFYYIQSQIYGNFETDLYPNLTFSYSSYKASANNLPKYSIKNPPFFNQFSLTVSEGVILNFSDKSKLNISDNGNGIESNFQVINENPNWTINKDKIKTGVDPNVRNINFELYSDGGEPTSEYLYPKKEPEVWIVIHGWYTDFSSEGWNQNYMSKAPPSRDIANTIKIKKPNDIILLLDWREAAGYSKDFIVVPSSVNEAAKWITPVSRETKKKLNEWGLDDGQKLNFVGHSLGTLMAAEIANEFGGGNNAVLLDPASQLSLRGEYRFKDYDLDGNTDGNQTALGSDRDGYFRNKFNFSRAFVGSNSIAGSDRLAITAHEAISMEFESRITGPGSEHFEVIETFDRINDDNKIYNNYLSLENMYRNKNELPDDSMPEGFEATLQVKSENTNSRNQTQYLQSRDGKTTYGTNINNNLTSKSFGETILAGGGGSDIFNNWGGKIVEGQYTTILDFSDEGDRISLSSNYNVPIGKTFITYNVRNSECSIQGLFCPKPKIIISRTELYGKNSKTADDLVVYGKSIVQNDLKESLRDAYSLDKETRSKSKFQIRS